MKIWGRESQQQPKRGEKVERNNTGGAELKEGRKLLRGKGPVSLGFLFVRKAEDEQRGKLGFGLLQ